MPQLDNLIGKRFGKWTVLSRAKDNKSHHPVWNCICDCGTKREVFRESLVRGNSKSCGCKFALRPFEGIYNILVKKNNGRGKPLPVHISYEEFLQFTEIKNCHYCGSDITWVRYNVVKYKTQAYNLDRKDPNIGYVMDNLVVCCKRCNQSKSNHFSYEEWVEIGKVIRTF